MMVCIWWCAYHMICAYDGVPPMTGPEVEEDGSAMTIGETSRNKQLGVHEYLFSDSALSRNPRCPHLL